MQSMNRSRQFAKKSLSSMGLTLLGCWLVGCSGAPEGSDSALDSASSSEAESVEQASEALSSYSFEYEYYKDSSYSVEVGYGFRDCSGHSFLQGKRTRFVIRSRTECHSGVTVGCWEIINGAEYCGHLACVIC